MRIKIMHNIGVLFVKMGETCFFIPCVGERYFQNIQFLLFAGQYNDACSSFEWIMSEQVILSSSSFCGGASSPKKGNFFRQNDRPIYFLQNQGDFKTGLHLILCYYATGDKDRMKKGFTQLVEIPLEV